VRGALIIALAGATGAGCSVEGMPVATERPPLHANQVRFAAIGDYGADTDGERNVAELVKSWNVDFVITLGDNNYPAGEAATIDGNIGKYYGDYIGGYTGVYGDGSPQNRFWPAVGNHDWYSHPPLAPYYDYFWQLPGNRRYYDFERGAAHLMAIDSDPHEPDGATLVSAQASWLKERLAARTSACWQIVFFHHPPYSSGYFVLPDMRWPFRDWGADLVMSGHEHYYERLEVDGIPYLINGLGGTDIFKVMTVVPQSQVIYRDDFGALLVTVETGTLRAQFFSISGVLADDITLTKACPTTP
jgi:hypothetical protein